MASYVVGQSGVMRLSAHFGGYHELIRVLSQFELDVDDLSDFYRKVVAPIFFKEVQQNIERQGALVGGWRALSARYAAWKRKHVGHTKIMVLTETLAKSLRIGGPGNVVQVTRRQALLGSRVPYLSYHQKGTRRMPQRLVLFWTGSRSYGRALQNFVADAAERSGLPNVRPRPTRFAV